MKNKGYKWQDIFVHQARELSAAGLTVTEIARAFKVTRKTLWVWGKISPEFYAALKEADNYHTTQKNKQALRRRAQGFYYTETTYERNPLYAPDGSESEFIITKKVRKHVVPDVKALIYALGNESGGEYRDVRHYQHGMDPTTEGILERITKANKRLEHDGGDSDSDSG